MNQPSPEEPVEIPPIIAPFPMPGATSEPGRPWGPWATVGWTALIGFAYVVVQTFAVGLFAGVSAAGRAGPVNLQTLISNGGALAFATVVSAPVVVGLCVLAARARGTLPVPEYFGLFWPKARVTLGWIAAFYLFSVAVDFVLSALDRTMTENFMREVLASTRGELMPLLFIGIVIAAPISEEMLFRGFLFAGLEKSRLGGYGTIAVTSVAFAVIHLQYDLGGVLQIFAVGAFLGFARLKTRSLYLCMALHAFLNVLAFGYYAFFDDGGSQLLRSSGDGAIRLE